MKIIAELDLARFERPSIPGNPPFAVRAAWYVVNAILFRSSLFGLAPSRAKAHILRLFGARVGRGVVIKPRVDIKSPWFLTLGDHVWLGERVWIDNHTEVTLGSNVCVSQGAYIFTGNHDWSNPAFPFFCKPVTVGDGAWVTAFQRLGPGTAIPAHMAVVE
ncbi:hypothetical protein [Acuticoccus yangtzensis]|uniref:hypothetical protein n=1 Tax=Acuticoccus yangtzensis TaxID=1443441 RepID=UPI0009496B68|nr:hypothetical protein [Acuticoccus yangtzensis]ORE92172.1 acyl transferase [Stappia sp. 22II-S9-Z10]